MTGPQFGFGHTGVWALFHPIAFDFSVWEMWGALLHGGRLVIVPQDVARDPCRFRDLLVGGNAGTPARLAEDRIRR